MKKYIINWWKYGVSYKWYNFKNGIKNLISYLPIIWKTRDFDYGYILKMQKFQLERLLKRLENGNEVIENRLPKMNDIKRCIELINNHIEDNYAERCGYDYSKTNFEFIPIKEKYNGEELYEMVNTYDEKQSKEDLNIIFDNARKLEDDEWKELWEIINKGKESDHGMRSWWD